MSRSTMTMMKTSTPTPTPKPSDKKKRPAFWIFIGICTAVAVAVVAFFSPAGSLFSLDPVSFVSDTLSALSWNALSKREQKLLAPLEKKWDSLTIAQKRKWIRMAKYMRKMPPEKIARIQANMKAWAALSPEQRAVARSNYLLVKKTNVADKQHRWDKYQQLPDDTKKTLAAQAGPPPPDDQIDTLQAHEEEPEHWR